MERKIFGKNVLHIGRPVEVNPLIKLARWVLLASGIVYGAVKHEQYSKIEKAFRENAENEKNMKKKFIQKEKEIFPEEISSLFN